MTTWGSDLNADVKIALFGEAGEGNIHAIAVISDVAWIGMRTLWMTKHRQRRTALVENQGKPVVAVFFFEVRSKMTSTLAID